MCFPSESLSWCCSTCSRCPQDRRAGWPSTSPRPPTTGSSTPAATWASDSMWRRRRVGAAPSYTAPLSRHIPLLITSDQISCLLSQTAPCLQAGSGWWAGGGLAPSSPSWWPSSGRARSRVGRREPSSLIPAGRNPNTTSQSPASTVSAHTSQLNDLKSLQL